MLFCFTFLLSLIVSCPHGSHCKSQYGGLWWVWWSSNWPGVQFFVVIYTHDPKLLSRLNPVSFRVTAKCWLATETGSTANTIVTTFGNLICCPVFRATFTFWTDFSHFAPLKCWGIVQNTIICNLKGNTTEYVATTVKKKKNTTKIKSLHILCIYFL